VIRTRPRPRVSIALVAFLPLSAAAFELEVPAGHAILRVIVPHEHGRAAFESEAGEVVEFTPLADGAATLATSPLPLPVEGFLTLTAPGHASERIRLAYGRATRGTIDLGRNALSPGFAARIRVTDRDDRPLEAAAIHSLPSDTRFPPREPADRSGPRVFLDSSNRVARSDENGLATLHVSPAAPHIAVLVPGYAPVFTTLAEGEHDDAFPVAVGGGPTLELALTATDNELLLDGGATAYVDLGGVVFETRLSLAAPTKLLLDRARALRIVVEARGFRTASDDVELTDSTTDTTSATLTLEALPLAYAKIEARDLATKRPLTLTDLRLGRARAHPREFPARVDFAPDWNSFRIGADEPPLCVAPPGRVDLLVSARDHQDTIVRGLEFSGTRAEPSQLVVELPGSLPIQGVVLDSTTGGPLSNAWITVRRSSRDLDDLPLAWKIRGTVGFVASTASNVLGRFRAESTSYEAVTIEVEAPGFAPTTFGPFARDVAHDLSLALERGFSAGGKVEGATHGDVVALLAVSGNRMTTSAIESDGSFRCDLLAEGEYRVIVVRDPRAALARGRGDECARLERAFEAATTQRFELRGDRLDLRLSAAD
jgi:hypothetical protein